MIEQLSYNLKSAIKKKYWSCTYRINKFHTQSVLIYLCWWF